MDDALGFSLQGDPQEGVQDPLHAKLRASLTSLNMARECATLMLRRRWTNLPYLQQGRGQLEQIAFTKAMIVSYGRALSPGAGNIAFPEELIGFEGGDRALHDKVLRLRLREFAQSQGAADAPAGNVVPLGAKPKPGNPFRDVFFTADELEQFLLMTHELMLRVGERVAYVGASKQSA
jgi:hypothetical protein